MDKKKFRNDIILIASLLLVAIIALIFVLSSRSKQQNIAKVYVQNEVVLTIDLSKDEENDYPVQGLHGQLIIHTRHGHICVSQSNCPHQDCVKTGYVSTSNRPIICVYNATYVVIEGRTSYDLEI